MLHLKRLFLMIILVTFSVSLHAQTHIQNFIVSIWPEYDHPGVLVILNGEVPESALPLDVSFPVPERARFALVAGSTDTTANSVIPVPIQDTPEGKSVSFQAVHPSFHVEFYFNPFEQDGNHRSYEYTFKSNLPIDSLIVDLQQPMTAENFTPGIQVDHQMEDSHGITYYRAHYNDVKAEQPIKISAEYDNPTGQLTNDLLQQQLGQSGGSGMGGQMGQTTPSTQKPGNKNSFWILLIVVILVLGVLYFVTQSKGKTPREETTSTPEQTLPRDEEKRESPTGETKYCIDCGEQIPGIAKFCTKCGASQPD